MATVIGIDPGEHTGVAIVRDGGVVFCATLPLHRAFEVVSYQEQTARVEGQQLLVVFEDARLRKWFPREKDNSEYRGRLMGAGAAKRDAKIWEEFLIDSGIRFEKCAPRPGLTKWSAEEWARVTGYHGRTSHHARDAALLVLEHIDGDRANR